MTVMRTGSFLMLLWLLPLAADDRDVRRLQDKFTAPCCWQESVAVHRSEIAAEMRAEIASMVAGGMTEEQVTAHFVARHGERILREPLGAKRLWLILIPVALIALAAAGLLAFLRRLRRRPDSTPDAARLPALPELDLD